jgi:hypothetical protein
MIGCPEQNLKAWYAKKQMHTDFCEQRQEMRLIADVTLSLQVKTQ